MSTPKPKGFALSIYMKCVAIMVVFSVALTSIAAFLGDRASRDLGASGVFALFELETQIAAERMVGAVRFRKTEDVEKILQGAGRGVKARAEQRPQLCRPAACIDILTVDRIHVRDATDQVFLVRTLILHPFNQSCFGDFSMAQQFIVGRSRKVDRKQKRAQAVL